MGSGLLYIVMTGCPDKTCLKKVMEPILRKLGPASFDCVDSKLAWSSKRPVWFQSIVDLLEPFFIPILGIFVSSSLQLFSSEIFASLRNIDGSLAKVKHLSIQTFLRYFSPRQQ